MGYELRRWLRDHLPPDCTPGERLVALEIADAVNDKTRRGWPGIEDLARWTGLTEKSVGQSLRRLAARGWELRAAVAVGKDGRLIYACNGRKLTYWIPEGSSTDAPSEGDHGEGTSVEDEGASVDVPSALKVRPRKHPSPQFLSPQISSSPLPPTQVVPAPRRPAKPRGEVDQNDQNPKTKPDPDLTAVVEAAQAAHPSDPRWSERRITAAINRAVTERHAEMPVALVAARVCYSDPLTELPGRLAHDETAWSRAQEAVTAARPPAPVCRTCEPFQTGWIYENGDPDQMRRCPTCRPGRTNGHKKTTGYQTFKNPDVSAYYGSL